MQKEKETEEEMQKRKRKKKKKGCIFWVVLFVTLRGDDISRKLKFLGIKTWS